MGDGERGAPQGKIDSEHIEVNRQGVSSSYEGWSYDDIIAQFSAVQASSIDAACTAWARVGQALASVADELQRIGVKMEDAWSSESSPLAQQHLQNAQATLVALANDCMHMQRATNQAHDYAAWYVEHTPGTGLIHLSGPQQAAVAAGSVPAAVVAHWKSSSDDRAAQDHIAGFMTRYNDVVTTSLPATVQYQLSQPGIGIEFPEPRPGGGSTSGASSLVSDTGGMGTSSWPGSSVSGGVSSPSVGGMDALTDPYGSGSAGSLAGAGGTSGLGGGTLGSGLGSGGGWGAGAGSGIGTGAGVGGVGGVGAGSGTGGGVGSGVAGGALGRGAGTGATGAGAAGRGGAVAAGRGGMMGGMPMGGRGGKDDEERERYSWLMEDEDTWGANTDAHPPIITE